MEFFSRTYSFWAGVAGGCFLTTATHGTDQLMVQRLLSARDERASRTALMASWVVILVQFTLFLLIGVLLYVHYADLHLTAPAQKDRLYPDFVWNNLPPGLSGLIIAAILAAAMANLSAALNSLASTTVVDFFRGRSSTATAAASLRLARLATVGWAVAMLPIAIRASHSQSVLETGLTIAAIPSGVLLGIFLLGVLTRKPRERAAIAGAAAGLCGILFVWLRTPIAFTWYVPIGTVLTFSGAMLAAQFERPLPPAEESLVRVPTGGAPYLPSRHAEPEEQP
jgi:Na+/proline symporter